MQKRDLGHGRGWLDAPAAASVRRIDRQLGRPADINDAGRSAAVADENYRKWLAYKNGGPWAPYALPGRLSVHCKGRAADSDDWYNAHAAAVWRDNGWRQTARYSDDRDEPWHGEYFAHLDNHRNDPAPAPAGDKPQPAPIPEPEPEEDDMALKVFGYVKPADKRKWYVQFDSTSGFWSEFVTRDVDYARNVAEKFGGGAPLLSAEHRDDLKAECERVAARLERARA